MLCYFILGEVMIGQIRTGLAWIGKEFSV